MELRTLLVAFLVGVLYPVWLLAGAADYMCHRRTDITHTSGAAEAWLHVAQFLCIGAILLLAAVLEVTALTWSAMLGAAVLHSALSYIDVAYTNRRRYISPFEQHVHGYMDVIPLVAVCLIGAVHWQQIRAGGSQPLLRLNEALPSGGAGALLGSFVILAGVPVLEELLRTLRARRSGHRPEPTPARLAATSQR